MEGETLNEVSVHYTYIPVGGALSHSVFIRVT